MNPTQLKDLTISLHKASPDMVQRFEAATLAYRIWLWRKGMGVHKLSHNHMDLDQRPYYAEIFTVYEAHEYAAVQEWKRLAEVFTLSGLFCEIRAGSTFLSVLPLVPKTLTITWEK